MTLTMGHINCRKGKTSDHVALIVTGTKSAMGHNGESRVEYPFVLILDGDMDGRSRGLMTQ